MPCYTRLKPRQTITERKEEIKRAVDKLAAKLSSGAAKAKIGPKGAIAFVGTDDLSRDGITDACAYRRIISSGSATAKAAIARAEALAGVRVSITTVALGVHSHDGGVSWHDHKG